MDGQNTSPLFNLPPEIRDMIYVLVFGPISTFYGESEYEEEYDILEEVQLKTTYIRPTASASSSHAKELTTKPFPSSISAPSSAPATWLPGSGG